MVLPIEFGIRGRFFRKYRPTPFLSLGKIDDPPEHRAPCLLRVKSGFGEINQVFTPVACNHNIVAVSRLLKPGLYQQISERHRDPNSRKAMIGNDYLVGAMRDPK